MARKTVEMRPEVAAEAAVNGRPGGDDGAGSGSNVAEFSVSELAGEIKRAVERGFGHVRLRGEISGFRGPHSSGHCYFSLKDDRAKIDAVVWRGVYAKLRLKPEEGMEVIAQGRVTTYPNSSKYQIVIESMEPAGIGALMALLEERKRKFAAEGMFDDARKRALPFLPTMVGIVTSPTGAVIRDMLHGFNERFPAHVVLWPVRVQGDTSAAEVAAAIRGFNQLPAARDAPPGALRRPDVLIVARGGGSLEDLWGFNEEVVVRAAAESGIPIISAVGHETDWTLVDLVADARAPTPTKAAEWAVPKFSELAAQCDDLGQRIRHGARRRLEASRSNLKAAARGLPRPEDLTAMARQHFDGLERRLGPALLANSRAHAMQLTRAGARLSPGLLEARIARAQDITERQGRRLRDGLREMTGYRRQRLDRAAGGLRADLMRIRTDRARERLDGKLARLARSFSGQTQHFRARLQSESKLLASLGYQSVLRRGYALVRTADGRMVRQASVPESGDAISIEFHDGTRNARITDAGSEAGPRPSGAAEPPATQETGAESTPAAESSPANEASSSKTRIKQPIKPREKDRQGSLF